METERTAAIIQSWFAAIGQGDMSAVMNELADDIEFILPKTKYNQIIPYVGTMYGRAQVAEAFRIRNETTEVIDYQIRDLTTQDNKSVAVIYTKAIHRLTHVPFEIEDSHHVVINDNGKIKRWIVYFDPTPEINAFRADIDSQLIAAVWRSDVAAAKGLLDNGVDARARDLGSGLTALMIAAGCGNAEMVRILFDGGADVFVTDSQSGASVLHKACQGGSIEVTRQVIEAGCFIDAAVPTTGHTPLMEAIWFKCPEIVQYLLDHGASLNLHTHYGFSLSQHIEFETNVNAFGRDRLDEARSMVDRRRETDQSKAKSQRLMEAVVARDLDTVRAQLAAGADVNERFPIINSFNDGHMPLHVAARDGTPEIVAELLQAGPDVNAIEPVFLATPLHKAVYNGHADITRLLVEHAGVDINFQGGTNGYTSLHDSLWHGHTECAEILVQAGARLDLRGHDGKTPLDLAIEVLGPEHQTTQLIHSKLGLL